MPDLIALQKIIPVMAAGKHLPKLAKEGPPL